MSDTPHYLTFGGFINPNQVGRGIIAQLERAGGLGLTDKHEWAIREALIYDNITLNHATLPSEAQAVVFARMARCGLALTPHQAGGIEAAISDNITLATSEERRARLAHPEAYQPRQMTALQCLLLSTDGHIAPDEIHQAMRADAERNAA